MSGESISSNQAVQAMLNSKAVLLPQADAQKCTACGTCVDQCPVGALSMDDHDLPRVAAETCITCFCCQEICPEKAMALH